MIDDGDKVVAHIDVITDGRSGVCVSSSDARLTAEEFDVDIAAGFSRSYFGDAGTICVVRLTSTFIEEDGQFFFDPALSDASDDECWSCAVLGTEAALGVVERAMVSR